MDLQIIKSELAARLETDPTGKLARAYIIEQKSSGLSKQQAHELLSDLYIRYRDDPDQTAISEQIMDSIGDLLDAIHGNCSSPAWIYPKD
ncbi:hypothetical protein [Pedosphaera parvula]|uniref:Uncharacterized protein n=1 Tax=Pedosphaera parvula (strain Ellin514) TaxID=320771 RepID=B9XAD4_PEDPL|nr:hypothetical protein [Pedosphaera parvula]EEF63475.1 hypothetical protein Cflav_PD6110 [Pedosphaera parvula Ellin514]